MRTTSISLAIILVACQSDDSATSAGTTGSTGGSSSGLSTSSPTTTAATIGTVSTDTGDSTTGDTDEDTTGGSESGSTGELACGNGVVEGDEVCDDGDQDDANGCSADCMTATCLVPITHATVQEAIDDRACPTIWIMPGDYGDITIDREATLEQVPLGAVTLDAEGNDNTVNASEPAQLRGITITGGAGPLGGGVFASAPLTLTNCVVEGNSAEAGGAGIYAMDDLTLDGTAVRSNTVSAVTTAIIYGGGIYQDGGTLTVTGASEVADNRVEAGAMAGSTSFGGGICSFGDSATIGPEAVVRGNIIDATANDVFVQLRGGGVVASGDLTIAGTVVDNEVLGVESSSIGEVQGGGIAVLSSLELTEGAQVTGNSASGPANAHGGGIWSAAATISITGAAVAGNAVTSENNARGGGIYFAAQPEVQIVRTTINGNATNGGGTTTGGGIHIDVLGADFALDIVNSTISGNTAGEGAGVNVRIAAFPPDVTIASSTITLNVASETGGGVTIAGTRFLNTILYGNIGGVAPDCLGAMTWSGYNLVGDATGCGSLDVTDTEGIDPGLLPLGDNGGPTETHEVPAGSAAENGGTPSGCDDPNGVALTVDQREMPREVDGVCDIGAFEIQ